METYRYTNPRLPQTAILEPLRFTPFFVFRMLYLISSLAVFVFPSSPALAVAGNINDDIKADMDNWSLLSRCYEDMDYFLGLTLSARNSYNFCRTQRTPSLFTAPPPPTGGSVADSVRNTRQAAENFPVPSSPFASWLYSPQTPPPSATESSFLELAAQGETLTTAVETKIGNLTCVLFTLNLLDAQAGGLYFENDLGGWGLGDQSTSVIGGGGEVGGKKEKWNSNRYRGWGGGG